jgi:hypothetical protein
MIKKSLPELSLKLLASSTISKSELRGFDLNQFCEHINASTVHSVSELQKGSNIRLLVLQADFEATVVIGMANTSRVVLPRIRNLVKFTFY